MSAANLTSRMTGNPEQTTDDPWRVVNSWARPMRVRRGTEFAHDQPLAVPSAVRPSRGARRICAAVIALASIAGGTIGCVKGNPASDTGDPGFPFGPVAIGIQPLVYVQDIEPIFSANCLNCHSSFNARGNYSVSMYASAIQGQQAGNAESSVVVDCAPGGSMYGYFTGDAVTKATEVFRWVVVYNMAQTR